MLSLALFAPRPKVDHPTGVDALATLVDDDGGVEEPVRRVISRRVRVGGWGWGCAAEGIGTGNSGRAPRLVSVCAGRAGGIVPSMECLRVLGRRAVENGAGVALALGGSLTLATGTGGVQLATKESKSGWILRSNGADCASAMAG